MHQGEPQNESKHSLSDRQTVQLWPDRFPALRPFFNGQVLISTVIYHHEYVLIPFDLAYLALALVSLKFQHRWLSREKFLFQIQIFSDFTISFKINQGDSGKVMNLESFQSV